MTLIKSSIRLGIAAIIASVIAFHTHWQESYWILMAALLGLQFSPHVLWYKKLWMLLVAGLIVAGIACVANLISSYFIVVALFLLLSTFITVYLGLAYYQMWGLLFITNLFAILSFGLPVDGHQGLQRFGCIVLGFVIAGLTQACVFPERLRQSAQKSLTRCLVALEKLNLAIFTCFMSRDYSQKRYLYEKILHEKRSDYLYAITEARRYQERLSNQAYSATINEIEHLYEITLSLSSLLLRVEDHTTFHVANVEFAALATSIAHHLQASIHLLRVPSRITKIDDSLEEAIFQLEEVERTALQVVAREPIVFLLFQKDLNAMQESLQRLAETLEQWLQTRRDSKVEGEA